MTAPLRIHASVLAPFTKLLSNLDAPVHELLRTASLPGSLASGGDGFVAAANAWDFADNAAATLGIHDLGWQAAISDPVRSLGTCAAQVAQASTLRSAIMIMGDKYQTDVPFVQSGISDGHEHAWLWRKRTANAQPTRATQLQISTRWAG
jgi:hypothetical protein